MLLAVLSCCLVLAGRKDKKIPAELAEEQSELVTLQS